MKNTKEAQNIKLRVEHLTRIFTNKKGETLTALEDINIEVEESEFVVLVGPSGCGKSTLLNILGGLDFATSGTAYIDDRPISGPGSDRGMVFQGYSLFPWLTVEQNVEFGLKMQKVPKRERSETARRYIELVGLTGFEGALPKELSGGMKQRVAIARTLAANPEVLFMDEPFGALDAQTRVVMQELLARISRQTKNTILFITHDIDEAILLGSKIYVMTPRPGRVSKLLRVNIEGERNHNTLLNPEFLAIKKEIMDLLWQTRKIEIE